MASHSHTRASACLAADLYSTVHFDVLGSQLTGLAHLKTLFVQLLLPEVDSLLCFCGEIFPHHTTVPFPFHESAETKEASVSLTLPLELKNEKGFLSLNISSQSLPVFTLKATSPSPFC